MEKENNMKRARSKDEFPFGIPGPAVALIAGVFLGLTVAAVEASPTLELVKSETAERVAALRRGTVRIEWQSDDSLSTGCANALLGPRDSPLREVARIPPYLVSLPSRGSAILSGDSFRCDLVSDIWNAVTNQPDHDLQTILFDHQGLGTTYEVNGKAARISSALTSDGDPELVALTMYAKAQFLAEPGVTVQPGGGEIVVVQQVDPQSPNHYEARYLDASRGFLPIKAVSSAGVSPMARRLEFQISYAQKAAGGWRPTGAVILRYFNDVLIGEINVRVLSYSESADAEPEATFQMRFPDGTAVTSEVEGIMYRVGELNRGEEWLSKIQKAD